MKCTVPGSNTKIMGRALNALSRIGGVLYIEPFDNGLSFKAVNSSKSTYAVINFLPNFFTDYTLDRASEELRESMKCKIAIKSCLSLIKMSNLSKKIESWQIKFDIRNCKIIFFIKCRNDVVKTHYIPILDSDSLQAFYAKDTITNSLIFRTNVLVEAINNFQANEDDVTFDLKEDCVFLRNYEESNIKTKVLKTELKIISNEFEAYQISNNTLISFSMKDFRIVLNFAEFLDLPVKFSFEATGKPVIFAISNDSTFEANFVMATAELETEENISVQVQNSSSAVIGNFESITNNTVNSQKSTVNSQKSTVNRLKRKEMCDIPLSSESLFNFQKIQNSNPQINTGSLNIAQQSNSFVCNDNLLNVENPNLDRSVIPPSPPCEKYDKIARKVFKRCFESTYNPSCNLPNASQILAYDSDAD